MKNTVLNINIPEYLYYFMINILKLVNSKYYHIIYLFIDKKNKEDVYINLWLL